jgi:hypothetical protein
MTVPVTTTARPTSASGCAPRRPSPECIRHGTEFLSGGVDENDVGYTVCLACAEKDGRLTEKGARELENMRLRAPMPALTLSQPWATLIARGAKRIETRGWHPHENPGVLAIASSIKRPTQRQRENLRHEPFRRALGLRTAFTPGPDFFPTGQILAVVVVKDFERIEEGYPVTGDEARFGDFTPGRWAWLLGEVVSLASPIHVSGARGVWKVPRHLIDKDGQPGPLVRAIGGRGEYRRLLRAAHG